MSTKDRKDPFLASDGLPARDNGPWGKDKLAFLRKFGPPGLAVASKKRTRVFLDLFAGPGINKSSKTGEEFDGSPLISLDLAATAKTEHGFTDAVYVNLDPDDHHALGIRLQRRCAENRSRIASNRITNLQGDANALLPKILDRFHHRSYIFAFADIENPSQLPWTSVERLRTHGGHSSVDLFALFPCNISLTRMAGYNTEYIEMNAEALSRYFGNDSWRDCLQHRQTDARSAQQAFSLCIERAYLQRLRAHWRHAEVVQTVRRKGRLPGSGPMLYKMIFASDHSVAALLGQRSAEQLRDDGQLGLELRVDE